jgi:hypothetical protein
MILGLFIESGILLLIGLFLFWKKKPLLGWVFTLASLAGFVLALIIIYLFPEKL